MTIKNLCVAALALALATEASAASFSAPVPVEGTQISGSAALKHKVIRRLGENSPLNPPFCETFDNFSSSDPWTDFERYFQVIDANADGRSWGFYNYAGERPTGRCAYLLFPIDVYSADDWLVTRAVRMEKGKYYCVSVDAGLYTPDGGSTPQVFEVKVGNHNDTDGLRYDVISETKVYGTEMTTSHGWFKPDFTATYYIGVHATSPRYNNYYNYLFVDNVAVEAPKSGTEPAEVTDIVITNDPNGATAANISFTAPAVAINGEALTNLTSITVKRGNTVVKTLTDVQPGKPCAFTDVADEGRYCYTFTATNSSGEGATQHFYFTVGLAAPLPPVVTSCGESRQGRVRLTWTAPTADVNGNAINPEAVTYNVYDNTSGTPRLVASDLAATEFDYDLGLTEGEQRMALCTLSAVIGGKESDLTSTDYIAVGTPYSLPHHNSFTLDDYYSYVMSTEVKSGVTWQMQDNYSDPDAQDGDNGYIAMVGNQPDQSCELQFGKIDLGNADMPILSFYTYVYAEDENELEVSIIDAATNQKQLVQTISLAGMPIGWQLVRVNLSDYVGQVIRLCINGIIHTHGYIPIDNLLIENCPVTELGLGHVDHPFSAKPGQDFEIAVEVYNNCRNDIEDFTLTLLADGHEVATVSGDPVAALSCGISFITTALTPAAPATTQYRIRVNTAADENPANDLSTPFSVVLDAPMHPAPTALTATEGGNGAVTLAWTAADLTTIAPDEQTEDFEQCVPFAEPLGNFTTMTLDEGLVAGFADDITMPNEGTMQGFWVMSNADPFGFFPTHSDTRAACAMYALNPNRVSVQSDDWLISPELYGGRQNISFWATSLIPDYGLEQFEVYYSTSGTDFADFELIMPETEAPADWTNYFVALPQGAKHFAIRYLSADRYMFIVDDITFIPAGAPRQLELMGYNVYRNDVLLNSAPVAATEFTTSRLNEAGDSFYVTAVYDKGESTATNVARVGFSGIDAIQADTDAPAEYFNLQGIRVSNPSRGIYLRRQGNRTVKIFVQ